MTRVIVDQELSSRLHDLSQPLELCDEAGHVLAVVTPMKPATNEDFEEPYLSPEELKRRENEPDFSTEEVLTYLKSLG